MRGEVAESRSAQGGWAAVGAAVGGTVEGGGGRGTVGAAVGGTVGGRRGAVGGGGGCGRGRRPRRPAPGAGAAATSAALPCGVRGISLRNGRGGRVATYRRAKAPRQGSAGPSSAGLRFVRWSSVRPLAFGRRARTRSKRGCRPRRTARPCRSRSRRPSP